MLHRTLWLLPLSVLALAPEPAAPPTPFADALAVWHFADLKDAAGRCPLKRGGDAEVGVPLEGVEKEASLRRGGDGRAAAFQKGWLDAGQGKDGCLNPTGEALTLVIRLRDPSGQWNTSLFSKHGGHDKLVYNLFTVDLGAGMILGFELGTERGMVQVSVPTARLDPPDGWHDVIARYDGRRLELYIDGVRRDERPASGKLRTGNPEPCLIGAESSGGKPTRPFRGLIDHAALWTRALTDAEIVALSGGAEEVGRNRARHQEAQAQVRANANVFHRQAVDRANAAVAKAVAKAAQDPNRPAFHFQGPALWMNDPNGPIFFQGEYHLFYQHNPYGEGWGHMHWGHAKSKDLVHWEHLPIALAPSTDLGEEHCFSGCCVVKDGIGHIFYTSIGPRTPAGDGAVQWLATSKDGLLTWEKHPANPVLTGYLHGDLTIHDWRDPFAWREGDQWFMVLGGHRVGGKGCVGLYQSADLVKWRFLHLLYEGQEGNWECPNFFKLGDKWVLIYSPHGLVRYYTGRLTAEKKFVPEVHGTLDGSDTFYAPNCLEDGRGRRLLWGWLRVKGSGWDGALTVPRVLTLRPDGQLGQAPAPELQALRGNHARVDPQPLGDTPLKLRGGDHPTGLEFLLEFDPGQATRVGLERLGPDGKAEPVAVFDRKAGQLLAGGVKTPLTLLPDEPTQKLQVLIDRSIVEVYVNGRACVSAPWKVRAGESVTYQVTATGGAAGVKQAEHWELRAAGR